MAASTYELLLEFALSVAAEASDMIRAGAEKRWRTLEDYDAKKNTVDLVTETDQAVEAMIKKRISTAYPAHHFIGEETYAAGEEMTLEDGYTWCVDPIDGTMNFIHSNPFVGCSIGLMHDGVPVVGVIAMPFLNQTISARRGGGAWMNGIMPLPLTGGKPQPLLRLEDCMIAAEWGTDRSVSTVNAKASSFKKLVGDSKGGIAGGQMVHALRTTGSSSCNIAMVAAGHLDVYWDAGCWAWDVCAGMCILEACGGYYSGGVEEFKGDATPGSVLLARRWCCIRAVPSNENESAREIQRRILKDLYDVVEPWTNSDM